MQVAAVNILNQALSQPEAAPKLAGLLSQEQGLLPAAMGLLDHSLPLLRAKAVISIVLLCRYIGLYVFLLHLHRESCNNMLKCLLQVLLMTLCA